MFKKSADQPFSVISGGNRYRTLFSITMMFTKISSRPYFFSSNSLILIVLPLMNVFKSWSSAAR